MIEKQQEEIDRLKNQNNKNSNNSSKPSSTNVVTPKKKTGANLYNYRTKTGNKIGGQYGHKSHNLDKKKIEKLIDENKIEVRTINHVIKGNNSKEAIIKYRVELEIRPYVERHIFKYSETANNELPKEFYTDVTYGNSIKALSIHLGRYLMELMENIPDTKWPFLMYDLIFRMNNTRKIAIEYGLTEFSKEKLEDYKKEYDKILELSSVENKNIKSSYYREKKQSHFVIG